MDIIDRAQARQLEEIEHALASRGGVEKGAPACTWAECGQAISDMRRNLGARYCLHHQQALEQGAKPWHVPVAPTGRNR